MPNPLEEVRWERGRQAYRQLLPAGLLILSARSALSAASPVSALADSLPSLSVISPVSGVTSLIISVWVFSGLILSVLGMVGLCLGKTFEQVKNRPIYLIDQRTPPGPNRLAP